MPDSQVEDLSTIGSASNPSPDEVSNLLALFPKRDLKNRWPEHRANKDEMTVDIASNSEFSDVSNFVWKNLHHCKQYIHFFRHDIELHNLPDSVLPPSQPLRRTKGEDKRNYLYILRTTYTVHLIDPYQRANVTFLWPVKVSVTEDHLYVSFVKLVKNMRSRFGDRFLTDDGKSLSRSSVIGSLGFQMESKGGINTLDLNKGIKSLMEEHIIDAKKARVRRSRSTRTESMDQEYTLKDDLSNEEYREIQDNPLLNSRFEVIKNGIDIDKFTCNPTEGIINFHRFSEGYDSNDLVRKVLRHNS